MRISDWSSDVCSSDLTVDHGDRRRPHRGFGRIGDQPARVNNDGFGRGRRGDQAGGKDKQQARQHGREPPWTRTMPDAASDVRHLTSKKPGACRNAPGPLSVRMAALQEEVVDHVQDFAGRSEEHTSELKSLMRISYAGFCL